MPSGAMHVEVLVTWADSDVKLMMKGEFVKEWAEKVLDMLLQLHLNAHCIMHKNAFIYKMIKRRGKRIFEQLACSNGYISVLCGTEG